MKITSFLTSALVGAAAARDTIYLVNSSKGNEVSSGMAYYGDGHESTGGSRPDDYVDVVHGSNVHWEGQPVKGKFSLLNYLESELTAIRNFRQWCIFHVKHICRCGW